MSLRTSILEETPLMMLCLPRLASPLLRELLVFQSMSCTRGSGICFLDFISILASANTLVLPPWSILSVDNAQQHCVCSDVRVSFVSITLSQRKSLHTKDGMIECEWNIGVEVRWPNSSFPHSQNSYKWCLVLHILFVSHLTIVTWPSTPTALLHHVLSNAPYCFSHRHKHPRHFGVFSQCGTK